MFNIYTFYFSLYRKLYIRQNLSYFYYSFAEFLFIFSSSSSVHFMKMNFIAKTIFSVYVVIFCMMTFNQVKYKKKIL